MLSLQENKEITELSNFKTKAFCRYFFEIKIKEDTEKLPELFSFIKEKNLKYLVVWWWTNMLFAFDNFDWVVIKNSLNSFEYNKKNKQLYVQSNVNITSLSKDISSFWSWVWDRFVWLPWSVWWAVYWNAWCFWLEIMHNFKDVYLFDISDNSFKTFDKSEMDFSYRSSILKEKKCFFIISANFDLSFVDEKYSSDVDIFDFRENKQPKWLSCGSFFKNPSRENPAWKLIEEAWLKWYKIWWAYFSEKHANFLMSDGTATHKDLVELKDLAISKVKSKFWIELVSEVQIIS